VQSLLVRVAAGLLVRVAAGLLVRVAAGLLVRVAALAVTIGGELRVMVKYRDPSMFVVGPSFLA
jgi:hypothetical protein